MWALLSHVLTPSHTGNKPRHSFLDAGANTFQECYLVAVPAGLKRFQQSGQSRFITFSCYHRRKFLVHDGPCDLFLRCLEATRRRYGFRVYGYVVMLEHVHLLLSEPDLVLLGTAIQALKLAVVRRAPKAGWTDAPPFWQKRYYDHNVRSYEAFVEKLRYLHLNPVTRGLVAAPEQWPWSSFRHYAIAEPTLVQIESQWTGMRRMGRIPQLPKPGRCGAPSW